MPKYYVVSLNMSSTAITNLLGGLAVTYRSNPKGSVKIELRNAIEDILRTLEREGVDISNKRSPFYTYSQLINYQSLNQLTVN